MRGEDFSFSELSAIEIIVCNENFLFPNEDFDSPKSNLKQYFSSNHFLQSFGSSKIASMAMLWTNLCAL